MWTFLKRRVKLWLILWFIVSTLPQMSCAELTIDSKVPGEVRGGRLERWLERVDGDSGKATGGRRALDLRR